MLGIGACYLSWHGWKCPLHAQPSIVSASLPTWWAHRHSQGWGDGSFQENVSCLSFASFGCRHTEVRLRPLLVSADLSSLERFGIWQCALTFASPPWSSSPVTKGTHVCRGEGGPCAGRSLRTKDRSRSPSRGGLPSPERASFPLAAFQKNKPKQNQQLQTRSPELHELLPICLKQQGLVQWL